MEHDTTNATIAAWGGKGLAAGATTGVLGWVTSDAFVGLFGLVLAVIGLLVTALFRYLDSRDKHRETLRMLERIEAEEERSRARHDLDMRVKEAQLAVYHAHGAGARRGAEEPPPPDFGPAP